MSSDIARVVLGADISSPASPEPIDRGPEFLGKNDCYNILGMNIMHVSSDCDVLDFVKKIFLFDLRTPSSMYEHAIWRELRPLYDAWRRGSTAETLSLLEQYGISLSREGVVLRRISSPMGVIGAELYHEGLLYHRGDNLWKMQYQGIWGREERPTYVSNTGNISCGVNHSGYEDQLVKLTIDAESLFGLRNIFIDSEFVDRPPEFGKSFMLWRGIPVEAIASVYDRQTDKVYSVQDFIEMRREKDARRAG